VKKDLAFIAKYIDDNADKFIKLSQDIWSYAELPFEEFKSAADLIAALKEAGFEVEEGVADMPTCFVGSYTHGSGGPVFGFLGEYDALDILSQEASNPEFNPIKPGAPGHGCGHNLLGVGALAAAFAAKEYMVAENKAGTVKFYGCPAEEGAGSKQFMARAGVFDDADFVYTWHPADSTEVQSTRSVAIMGGNFLFKGITAHAGGSPWLGRSALDAAELMSSGCNYLREHMFDQERIHYAYMDAGGTAPNIVQERALVKYEVRSPKVADLKKLWERVVKVAKGAAMMTETNLEYEVTMAFSDYISNDPLSLVAEECLNEVGAPQWDEEDYKLAKAFVDSFNPNAQASIREKIAERYGADKVDAIWERPLSSEIGPFIPGCTKYQSGSTDVGDVCYAAPTTQFRVATTCIGNVGHSWQMTAQSNSSIGHKGMIVAAKAMALSAIRTMDRPDVIEEAKKFTLAQNGGKYVCPLPDDVTPPIGRY
jgi:aminobenzoyl-glutamate utilization protein B